MPVNFFPALSVPAITIVTAILGAAHTAAAATDNETYSRALYSVIS
jgi:hypothetical protein